MTKVLVIGGTGTMGAPVVQRLAARSGSEVAVLTRDPGSDRARALLSAGSVHLVRGDVDDAAALGAAMAGVDEVFANTDFFSTSSPAREHEQGLGLLTAAERAGVDRFVWSSLDAAATLTDGRIPVPHYDAKAAVEAHIGLRRAEEFMRQDPDGWYSRHVAVLVTAPYFENMSSALAPRRGVLPDGRDGLVVTLPLGEGRWPLIALEDIAWFTAHVLEDWERWGGRTLRVAGDSLTGAQIAEVFERVTGIPAAYQDLPLDVVRAMVPGVGHDLAAMFALFQDVDVVGRARDLAALREIHPDLVSFEGWLRSTGWTAST